MFDKPLATIFGVGLFLWIGLIMIEGTPSGRLSTACAPVRWGGNIMQSMAALSDSESLIEKVSVGTDEVDYGCQFTLWRLIYGKDYGKHPGATQPARSSTQFTGDEVLPPGGISVEDTRSQSSVNHPGKQNDQNKIELVEKPEKK